MAQSPPANAKPAPLADAVQAASPPSTKGPQAPAAVGGATPDDTLKLRRNEIEERERQLSEREAAVAATGKRLADRVAELGALQSRLQPLAEGLKQRDEANWSGLVKLYEGMRPREAASIFDALDKPVLLEILDRMKPAKAAPVIAAMEPERARQVTADLASKRTKSTTVAN
jgi:flagellar motility protein MotE (MotC chaperone)